MARIRSKFMFNRRTNHPAIVFEEFGNKYGYISITHSKIYRRRKNIPLPENPEKGNTTKAYILPNPRKDKKNHLLLKRSQWLLEVRIGIG